MIILQKIKYCLKFDFFTNKNLYICKNLQIKTFNTKMDLKYNYYLENSTTAYFTFNKYTELDLFFDYLIPEECIIDYIPLMFNNLNDTKELTHFISIKSNLKFLYINKTEALIKVKIAIHKALEQYENSLFEFIGFQIKICLLKKNIKRLKFLENIYIKHIILKKKKNFWIQIKNFFKKK